MTLPTTPARGGFHRAEYLGFFIRDVLSGNRAAPVIIPKTFSIQEISIKPERGMVLTDLRRRYRDALRLGWARRAQQEAVRRGKGEGFDLQYWLSRAPRQGPNAQSFYGYVRILRTLGWLEYTGEQEPSAFMTDGTPAIIEVEQGKAAIVVPLPRLYVRLTSAGLAAPDDAWREPKKALYGEGAGFAASDEAEQEEAPKLFWVQTLDSDGRPYADNGPMPWEEALAAAREARAQDGQNLYGEDVDFAEIYVWPSRLVGGADQPDIEGDPAWMWRRSLAPDLPALKLAERYARPAVQKIVQHLELMEEEGRYSRASVLRDAERIKDHLQGWLEVEEEREDPTEAQEERQEQLAYAIEALENEPLGTDDITEAKDALEGLL